MHQPLRLALLVASIYSGGVLAQAKPIDISAQSLGSALTTLASQSGIQILFSADELKGAQASALRGQLGPEEALRKLLESSGFTFNSTGKGTYVVQKRPAEQGNKQLSEVRVTANAEQGYKADKITVAGKVPLTPREIPNSVSVLTRQQMDDQNMVTVWDALSQITGVQAISNDTTQGQYHSRGAALEIQHDGVPSGIPLSGYQQFDLALYERIEVLRGPAGLLQGSGAISGVVNFVRKHAADTYAANFVASTGTWNNNRLEADVTGPLNADKSLRGRAVVSYLDRDYVYNRAHDKKWLGYGTLEYVFSPSTSANVFLAIQDTDSTGFSGLPTYTNGKFLNVDRSFNPYPDWNTLKWRTMDIGTEVKHKFDNAWNGTLRVNRRKQSQYFKDGYANDGVNPSTGIISSYMRREFDYDYLNESIDAFASGPFELLGRQHNLTVGANFSRFESTGQGANGNSPGSSYLKVANVLLTDPPAVAEPSVAYTTGSKNVTTQTGLYGQARFSLLDPLTLVIGGRFSDYSYKSRTTAPNPSPTDWAQGAKTKGEFSPYAGLLFDVSKHVTLYGSYSDIFVPQTQKRVDGSTLEPRVGRQFEVGSKTEFFDGKLGATLALFNIRDTNRALTDTTNPNYYIAAGELESKGWELEVTGSPLPRWDISGGYTNLKTEYLKHATAQGQPVSFWYPKEMFKLWNMYRFGEGMLNGVSLGVGLVGATQSASGTSTSSVMARGQNGYVVTNLQIGYAINQNYKIALNANNIFDKTYYTRLGGTNTYNTFGDPRNYMLTLRVSY